MKLPPAALTAPSLCPRCDSPAIMTDYCIACTLPLRRCGSCRGVAGPFDRFCGFCGYEIVRGARRTPVWRLWLLAALIPLLGGIAFGLSPYSAGLGARVETAVGARVAAGPPPAAHDAATGVGYTAPQGWAAGDEGSLLVIAKWPPDAARIAPAQGALLGAGVQSSTIVVSRPALSVPVDASDPQAVLAFDLAQLLQSPPAGTKLTIVRPIAPLTIGGRPAAETLVSVTRADGSSWYLDRAYITSAAGLVRADALASAADWSAGDDKRVESTIHSLRV